jgi:hypothetical protein
LANELRLAHILVATVIAAPILLALNPLAGSVSETGRWACLFAGPAVAGAVSFFGSQVATGLVARGGLIGLCFVMLYGALVLGRPIVSYFATLAIALVSYFFVNLTLSAAFELGQRQQERNQHGR